MGKGKGWGGGIEGGGKGFRWGKNKKISQEKYFGVLDYFRANGEISILILCFFYKYLVTMFF